MHIACRLRLAALNDHVGRARRLLMDEACLRLLSLGRFSSLIISTDTRVVPDWLAAIRIEIAAGIDAAVGTPSPMCLLARWLPLRPPVGCAAPSSAMRLYHL